MFENLHKTLPFCVLCFFFFFLITQYDNVLLKKFKIETHLNDAVPLIWIENIALSVCIGLVRLYSVRDLRLRCPHHTGIGAPFAFRLPTSATSVDANGGAGGSVLSVPVIVCTPLAMIMLLLCFRCWQKWPNTTFFGNF